MYLERQQTHTDLEKAVDIIEQRIYEVRNTCQTRVLRKAWTLLTLTSLL
jgi:hypothetical protein